MFKLTVTKADGTVKELKMKTKKKICSNDKSMLDSFLKFQLLKDSKQPSNEWCQARNTSRVKLWSKMKQPNKHGGIGIPCGKVNDCFVVDLDNYKWDDDHPFFQKFGKEKIHEKFNTYVQQSAGGGLHLFFKYDKEFVNANHSNGVDILSDINSEGQYKGKYVVGAGSTLRFTPEMQKKYKTKEKFGTYKILNNKPVTECPEELKQWLRDNIYNNKDIKKKKKAKENKQIVVTNTPEYYKYNLSELRVSMICEELYKKAPHYFTEYRSDDKWSWLVFTTAMKAIGHYKMWDKYSKKYGGDKYNKSDNDKIWNGITEFNKYNCFNKILHEIDERTLLDYVKYKPIQEDKLRFTKEGEWDKLSKHLKLPQTDVQIKSDTGTGKTTIVAEHFKKNKHMKFISIVSRKSLGYGQYANFKNNFDLDCLYYEEFEKMLIPKDNNVVIQIDSIMKIQSYKQDIHEYTIFLDEYSSLIEHLITSPTLNKTRAVVFKLFKYIITNARQVICVDADLNKHTLDFLKLCERPINIWNNTFIHNKGVPVKEWSNTIEMIEDMKTKDKFLCCLDSRTLAKAIPEEHFNTELIETVNDNEVLDIDGNVVNKYSYSIYKDAKGLILVITSDNDIMPDDLEPWPRIFVSPKVSYGNDLNKYKRHVFAIYKEHTISPKTMVQQICRCRKIIQLNYLFLKKKFVEPKFIDVKDVYDWNKSKEEFAFWEEVFDDVEVVTFYKKLLAVIQYNNDCYETNKFVHFRNMLNKKGFEKVPSTVVQTSKKELAQLEEKQKKNEVLNFDTNHPKNIDRNGLLNLPEEEMKKYRLLFVRDTEWLHYKNTRDYLLESKQSLNTEVGLGDDFNINKIKTNKNKLLIISRLMTAVGCENKFNITPTKNLTKQESDKWYEELEMIFRLRMKEKPDLTKDGEVQSIIVKCYKQLFGSSIKNYIDGEIKEIKLVNSKRRTVNGRKITVSELNSSFFDEVNKIMKYDMPEYKWKDSLSFSGIEYNFDDDE